MDPTPKAGPRSSGDESPGVGDSLFSSSGSVSFFSSFSVPRQQRPGSPQPQEPEAISAVLKFGGHGSSPAIRTPSSLSEDAGFVSASYG